MAREMRLQERGINLLRYEKFRFIKSNQKKRDVEFFATFNAPD